MSAQSLRVRLGALRLKFRCTLRAWVSFTASFVCVICRVLCLDVSLISVIGLCKQSELVHEVERNRIPQWKHRCGSRVPWNEINLGIVSEEFKCQGRRDTWCSVSAEL